MKLLIVLSVLKIHEVIVNVTGDMEKIVLAPFMLYYIMLCYITLCYVNVMKSASLTNAKEVIPCSLFPRGKSYASTVETKSLLSFKICWSAAWLLNRDAWLYNLCHFTYPFSLSFLSQIPPFCHSSPTVPVSLLCYPTLGIYGVFVLAVPFSQDL